MEQRRREMGMEAPGSAPDPILRARFSLSLRALGYMGSFKGFHKDYYKGSKRVL